MLIFVAFGRGQALPAAFLDADDDRARREGPAAHHLEHATDAPGRRSILPRAWCGQPVALVGTRSLHAGIGPHGRAGSAPTDASSPEREPSRPRRFGIRRRRRDRADRAPEVVEVVDVGDALAILASDDAIDWLTDLEAAPSAAGSDLHERMVPSPGTDVWAGFADELEVRELQAQLRSGVERELSLLGRAQELRSHDTEAPGHRGQERAVDAPPTDPRPSAADHDEVRLEDEFWAEGSNMSEPGWFLRRKRRNEPEELDDDEPTVILDLSAYDVAPERRGAFRDAVAEAGERERAAARTESGRGPGTT
jgi:hypothetical protein